MIKKIGFKKEESRDTKPRFAMRKLSVGLVSCMLGFLIFSSQNISYADGQATSDTANNVVVTESADQVNAVNSEVNDSKTADTTTDATETDETSSTDENSSTKVVSVEPIEEERQEVEYGDQVSGYTPQQAIVTTKETNEKGCVTKTVTKSYTNKGKIEAESIMSRTKPYYTNNGFVRQVVSENNHSNYDPKIEGPGNAEVQHFESSYSNGAFTQYWRNLFATDLPIKDVTITFTVPQELTESSKYEDTTSWVVNRFYPAMGKVKYTAYDYSKARFEIVDGKLVAHLGAMDAFTAFGLTIPLRFNEEKSDANDNLRASFVADIVWADSVKLGEDELISQETVCPDPEPTPDPKPNPDPEPTPDPRPDPEPTLDPEQNPALSPNKNIEKIVRIEKKSSKNPKTGIASSASTIILGLLSSGAYVFTRKKK